MRAFRFSSGYFNPRSPCGERRLYVVCWKRSTIFQSTLPVWGATPNQFLATLGTEISIHAPRVGSDGIYTQPRLPDIHFNPRSPCGERLNHSLTMRAYARISIHAPRVGSDIHADSVFSPIKYFNPRSPCGERPGGQSQAFCSCAFQSTLPVWGATRPLTIILILSGFQSTLPVWGATPAGYARVLKGDYFNPRSPCGERRDAWDT